MEWITNEGLLGKFNESSEIKDISIRYKGDVNTVFKKISGIVPFDINEASLVSGTTDIYEVKISGTLPVINETVDYYFTCRISNDEGNLDRYFYITSQNLATEWDSSQSTTFTITSLDSQSIQLKLNNPNGDEQFFKNSGSLPDGFTLSETGILYGSILNDYTSSYTFDVLIKRNNEVVTSIPAKTFTINVEVDTTQPPIWITDAGLLGNLDKGNYSSLFVRAYAISKKDVYYEYDDNIQTILNNYGLYIVTGLETESQKSQIIEQYQVLYSDIVPGAIIGKLNSKQNTSIGFDAYAIIVGEPNKRSTERTFQINLNHVNEDEEISWDEDETYDLGKYKVGNYINFDLTSLIQNEIHCSYSYSGGNLPIGITINDNGIISGEVSYQSPGEYTFYITASSSVTYSRKEFKMTIEKGYGRNSYHISLPVNLEYINKGMENTFDTIITGIWDVNNATDYSGLDKYKPIAVGDSFLISGEATINGYEYSSGQVIKFINAASKIHTIVSNDFTILSSEINNTMNENSFDELRSKFNSNYTYESYNPAYQIDTLPKIDVCTCSCFDKTLMNALLDFGNDIIMNIGHITRKDYNSDSLKYTVYYKELIEEISEKGLYSLNSIKKYLIHKDYKDETSDLGYWYENDFIVPETYSEENKYVEYIKYNNVNVDIGRAYVGNFYELDSNTIVKDRIIYVEENDSGEKEYYVISKGNPVTVRIKNVSKNGVTKTYYLVDDITINDINVAVNLSTFEPIVEKYGNYDCYIGFPDDSESISSTTYWKIYKNEGEWVVVSDTDNDIETSSVIVVDPRYKKSYLGILEYNRFYRLSNNVILDINIDDYETSYRYVKVPYVYAPKPTVEPVTSWDYILGSVANIRKQLSYPIYVKKATTEKYYNLTSMTTVTDIDSTISKKKIYYKDNKVTGEIKYYISDEDGTNEVEVLFESNLVKNKTTEALITSTLFIPSTSSITTDTATYSIEWNSNKFYFPLSTSTYPIFVDEIPTGGWLYDSSNLNNPEALTTVYSKDIYLPSIEDGDVVQNQYIKLFDESIEKLISWKEEYFPTLNIFYSQYGTNVVSYNSVLAEETSSGKYYLDQKFRFKEVFCQPKYNSELENEIIQMSSYLPRNWFASGITDGTQKTLTITPNPVDSTVEITATGYTQVGNTITVPYGTMVSYKVSHPYCDPSEGTVVMVSDTNLLINLELQQIRYTINSTPNDATIKVYVDNIYVGYSTGTYSAQANYNSIIKWEVSREGYYDRSETFVLDEEKTIDVSLSKKNFSFTIAPTPTDSTVTLTATGYTQSGNSIIVPYETSINWAVSKLGYTSQSGTQILLENTIRNVSLAEKYYTITIITTPADATCSIVYNGQTYTTKTISVQEGKSFEYTVSRYGYTTVTGTHTATQDETFTVSMNKNTYTYTIVPIPADATVTLTATGYTQVGNSITVPYETVVSWEVSATGYVSQSGSETILNNTVEEKTLSKQTYTLTVSPTPADATVTLTATGYTQIGNTITVQYGDTVNWVISKTGYETQSGSQVVSSNMTLEKSLTPKLYKFRVIPNPSTSLITLTATGFTQIDDYILVYYGTEVTWTVAATGYVTQTGTYNVTADVGYSVSLSKQTYTLTVSPTPADATVTLTASGYTQVGNSITVPYLTDVSYLISKTGYVPASGTKNVSQNETLSITLIQGYPVELGDYEYTRDSSANVVLTKYIGSSTVIVTPYITP